jgi:adenosylcobinamide-GDP ribazoletransferase
MREFAHFLNALRFLTVVPLPASAAIERDWLIRSAKYFPAIGILVGIVAAAVLLMASLIWGGTIPAILSTAASIALTGALHEDGLADTADGLGGGRTTEQRLQIMKDSRIGAYGALALGFGVALRVAALSVLPGWIGAAALVAVHGAGRFAAVATMISLDYAGDPLATRIAHTKDALHPTEIVVAIAGAWLAWLPLALLTLTAASGALLAGTLLAMGLVVRARKLIGGYTGDVLGAVEQVFEVGFLLGVAALVR